MELSKNCRVVMVKAAQTTGTVAVVTDVVDTAGYEGVMFVGSIATANAGNFVTAQQGMVADGSASADLLGSKNVIANNGDSFLLDVYKPRERFVKATITRAGATTVTGDVYAILYGPRVVPTTHGATISRESFVSPAEGVA